MFRKILVPLDLTDKHQAALEHAAHLAQQSGGEVILLHVIETIPGLSLDEEVRFYERLKRKAHEHMQRRGAYLQERKVTWREEVVIGKRAADIVKYAGDHAAELIVLTSPYFDEIHPTAGWGSLSWKLGILAPCPVLLVK